MSKCVCAATSNAELPSLPTELWFQIAQTAWTNLADLGVKRLVSKRFASQLRRTQHNVVFMQLVDKRKVNRARAAQQSETSDLSDDEQNHRNCLESIGYVDDTRLYVFFKLLVHNMDPSVRRTLRIKGIEALRECNKWFEDADLR